MSNHIDHSDLIARLSVSIQLLQEFDADGRWQHDPLLLAYLRDHYCLSLKQANQLANYLSKELEIATSKFDIKQMDIFG